VRRGWFTFLFATVALVARDARAADAFEIQVYDGTANPPGSPGLELHLNRVFDGIQSAEPPELPPHHQTHFTLEPSIGVTPFLELGAYFQTALRGDGTFDYAGTKLRTKFVTPPGWAEHFRLGVNLEVSVVPETYERSRWASEIRPILAWENEIWIFAANPILDVPLAAPGVSDGPSFEPAAMAKLKIAQRMAVGLEYYAALGPIARPLARDETSHYLYEVVDLLGVAHFELSGGVGEGLNAASNALIAKLILGYTWDTVEPPGARGSR
jgi:hypothetical protein